MLFSFFDFLAKIQKFNRITKIYLIAPIEMEILFCHGLARKIVMESGTTAIKNPSVCAPKKQYVYALFFES